jgi:hypothetical protein
MLANWRYPIYLIPHGSGFASIVDPDGGESPEQLLVVHTDEDQASTFMVEFGILGSPRSLANDREFSWLLRRLKHPVTRVAFDPRPELRQVNARLTLRVEEILEQHLRVDFSPWNYPVFVIAQEHGFASIEVAPASVPDADSTTALSVFTDREKAHSYLEAAGETGTLCELTDLALTRRLLEFLADDVAAVALNPHVDQDRRLARHTFAIRTLLERYLVHEQDKTTT